MRAEGFSLPPPLAAKCIRRESPSTSSTSTTGSPRPVLSPVFLEVNGSTALGLSRPFSVALLTASSSSV